MQRYREDVESVIQKKLAQKQRLQAAVSRAHERITEVSEEISIPEDVAEGLPRIQGELELRKKK